MTPTASANILQSSVDNSHYLLTLHVSFVYEAAKNPLEDVTNIYVHIEPIVRGIHERKVHRHNVKKVVGK